MENSRIKEQNLATKFRDAIAAIHVCSYCQSSAFLGGITSPSPDGKTRIIYCLNHKPRGIILERFEFEPAGDDLQLQRLTHSNTN